MRNLLALLGAAIVSFALVGWYLDWYKLRRTPAEDGHHSVNIDIDRGKIGKDLQRGGERLHDVIERSKRDSSTPAPKEPSSTLPPLEKSIW
jgi:hypothetical protein